MFKGIYYVERNTIHHIAVNYEVNLSRDVARVGYWSHTATGSVAGTYCLDVVGRPDEGESLVTPCVSWRK